MNEATALVRAVIQAAETRSNDLVAEERACLSGIGQRFGEFPVWVEHWQVSPNERALLRSICERLELELESHWRVVRESHPHSPAMELAMEADRAKAILEAQQPGSTPRFSAEPYISRKAWDMARMLSEFASDAGDDWLGMVLDARPAVGHLLVDPSPTNVAELLTQGLVCQDEHGTYYIPRQLATYVEPPREGWIRLKRG